MKKIFFSLFLLLYAVSNIGATVQLHMCCGNVVNWTLKEVNQKEDSRHASCCGENSPGVEDECCQDKDISIKIDQPQLTSSIAYLFNAHYSAAHNLYVNYSQFLIIDKESDSHHIFPQPPPNKAEGIGLFILYKQLKLAC